MYCILFRHGKIGVSVTNIVHSWQFSITGTNDDRPSYHTGWKKTTTAKTKQKAVYGITDGCVWEMLTFWKWWNWYPSSLFLHLLHDPQTFRHVVWHKSFPPNDLLAYSRVLQPDIIAKQWKHCFIINRPQWHRNKCSGGNCPDEQWPLRG